MDLVLELLLEKHFLKNYATIIFSNSSDKGGAEVIKWKNKELKNI